MILRMERANRWAMEGYITGRREKDITPSPDRDAVIEKRGGYRSARKKHAGQGALTGKKPCGSRIWNLHTRVPHALSRSSYSSESQNDLRSCRIGNPASSWMWWVSDPSQKEIIGG